MGKPILLLASLTYALRGRELLASRGIRSYVERVSFSGISPGCGYSLLVPKRADEAESILRAAGISVAGRAERNGAR